MTHILIIEDEEKIRAVLQKFVAAEGYTVELLAEGTHAVEQVRSSKPDLILLDLMLPGKLGVDICKEVRQFSQVPIIMVTAKVEGTDILSGLEIGADDYIKKPFDPREVIARIKTLLRRTSIAVDQEKLSHGLVLDPTSYSASLDGKSLELTPVEFRILVTLYGSPARVFSRSQLLVRMYNDHREVSDRTVDCHITNLRKKLKAIRPESKLIEPVYGVGYRYIG